MSPFNSSSNNSHYHKPTPNYSRSLSRTYNQNHTPYRTFPIHLIRKNRQQSEMQMRFDGKHRPHHHAHSLHHQQLDERAKVEEISGSTRRSSTQHIIVESGARIYNMGVRVFTLKTATVLVDCWTSGWKFLSNTTPAWTLEYTVKVIVFLLESIYKYDIQREANCYQVCISCVCDVFLMYPSGFCVNFALCLQMSEACKNICDASRDLLYYI